MHCHSHRLEFKFEILSDFFFVDLQGKIEVQGSPAELAHSGVDFAELIGENENRRSRPQSRTSSIRSMSIRSLSSTSLCSMGGESIEEIYGEEEPDQAMQMESSSKGKVKGSNALNYFNAAAHWSVLASLAILFILTQLFASGADYWVSYFTKQEESRLFYSKQDGASLKMFDENNVTISKLNETSSQDQASDAQWLSTDMCLYIHGGFMLGLWTLASIRWANKINKHSIEFDC